jgi:imidazole glycerol-phosphate synthase subunit HisH|tara:strand:- start:1760 stop:2362 length:603 start_codon:yes stop_codon:yes gene_type:complete
MKIGIIDYGCGNTSNIIKAFNKVGINCGLIKNKKDIMNFEKIILPGMGSAPHAMRALKQNKLDLYIKKFNENLNPILGICLGFQLALNTYEISKTNKLNCLSLIKGSVKKIENVKYPLPIINWIKVESKDKKENLTNKSFYFSHGYYCDLNSRDKNITFVNVSSKKIISSYENKNLYFYQFHPELSGKNGLNLLKKFKEL